MRFTEEEKDTLLRLLDEMTSKACIHAGTIDKCLAQADRALSLSPLLTTHWLDEASRSLTAQQLLIPDIEILENMLEVKND